jgi:hypothetical protein
MLLKTGFGAMLAPTAVISPVANALPARQPAAGPAPGISHLNITRWCHRCHRMASGFPRFPV